MAVSSAPFLEIVARTPSPAAAESLISCSIHARACHVVDAALKYSAVGRMRQKEGGKKDPMSEDYDGDSFTAKVNKFFDDFVGGGNK